jgi:hypothetical protein
VKIYLQKFFILLMSKILKSHVVLVASTYFFSAYSSSIGNYTVFDDRIKESFRNVYMKEIVDDGMRFMMNELVPYLQSADPGFNFNYLPEHLRASVYALRSAGVPFDLILLSLQYVAGFRENLMKKHAMADSLLSSMQFLKNNFSRKVL